jgi:pimeloyl-ACP methyl ester carboxylesterase
MLRPRSEDLETFLDEELASWQLTAGPGYPPDATWVREQAITALNRARHPEGVQRHLAAIIASPDRREGLSRVTAPTLVLHGEDDPLVQIDGGEATHAAIAHSHFHRYPGLGHQIPEPLWDDVAARISGVANLA